MKKINVILLAVLTAGIITFIGFQVDAFFVKKFGWRYLPFERAAFYYTGWPLIALIVSALFYRTYHKILGLAFFIAGIGPFIGISIYTGLWGGYVAALIGLSLVALIIWLWRRFVIREAPVL